VQKILIFYFLLILSKPVYADPKMELGLDVFNNKAMCGTCHALKTAGSVGEIGPNLDMLKPQLEQVINVVTNGIGVMPSLGRYFNC